LFLEKDPHILFIEVRKKNILGGLVMFIVWLLLATVIYLSPVLVARFIRLSDWHRVLDYVLLYGWTGVGWISAWCLLLEIRLENKV